jgi:hypothetical protein
VKENIPPDPGHIRLLRSVAVVLQPKHITYAVKQFWLLKHKIPFSEIEGFMFH